MGDDERRPTGHQPAHRELDLSLGSCIDRRRCFIENQHVGSGDNRPSDRQQLPLTLGQVVAALGQYGVVPVRQPFDETVCVGIFGSFNALI